MSVTWKYPKRHFIKEALIIDINLNELKAEIARNGMKREEVAEALDISRSSLTRKMKGETTFTHPEMIKLQKTLKLSGEKMINIFFSSKVS